MEMRMQSMRSDEKAYVRFINGTHRTVEVTWINFTGGYVNYQLLEHGRYVDVNTYKGHPWIAIDHTTKDRLHVDKKFVYFPQTTKEYFAKRCPEKTLPAEFEARIKALITVPVYSLRYRCLLALRDLLGETEDVDTLELPKGIVSDLKRIMTRNNIDSIEFNRR